MQTTIKRCLLRIEQAFYYQGRHKLKILSKTVFGCQDHSLGSVLKNEAQIIQGEGSQTQQQNVSFEWRLDNSFQIQLYSYWFTERISESSRFFHSYYSDCNETQGNASFPKEQRNHIIKNKLCLQVFYKISGTVGIVNGDSKTSTAERKMIWSTTLQTCVWKKWYANEATEFYNILKNTFLFKKG